VTMLALLPSVESFAPSLPLVQAKSALMGARSLRSCKQNFAQLSMQRDNDSEKSRLKIPSSDKITENMKEGTVGERGEVYVGLQFLFVFLVFIAPGF
jgi:hypothetical protein